jgi:hypothetical protein
MRSKIEKLKAGDVAGIEREEMEKQERRASLYVFFFFQIRTRRRLICLVSYSRRPSILTEVDEWERGGRMIAELMREGGGGR